MSRFLRLVRRDLVRAFGTGAALPIIFFLLVATLFPFAVGPDLALLGKVGGGALWTAALLAALLPVERLLAPDLAAGTLDQLVVRGIGEEEIALARIVAHWMSFGPPLMLAALPASALMGLDGPTLAGLELGLLIGTPGLAALSVATAALTAGLRGAGALAGLILLPLAVPLLIFGAGALGPASAGAYKLLAATSLLFVASAPFAAGAALRATRT